MMKFNNFKMLKLYTKKTPNDDIGMQNKIWCFNYL